MENKNLIYVGLAVAVLVGAYFLFVKDKNAVTNKQKNTRNIILTGNQ